MLHFTREIRCNERSIFDFAAFNLDYDRISIKGTDIVSSLVSRTSPVFFLFVYKIFEMLHGRKRVDVLDSW